MSNLAVTLITAGVMAAIFAIVLALVLRFRKPRKFDGFFDVMDHDARLIFQLEITTEPEDLRKQKYITFKIRPIKSTEESQRIHGS